MTKFTPTHYPAMEALGSEIGVTESFRLLTGFIDAFGRLVHNLRTNVLGTFRAFKRSELRAYKESHSLAVARLLGQAALPHAEVTAPIPDGMHVPYQEAAAVVRDLFTTIDIEKVVTTIEQRLAKLSRAAAPELAAMVGDLSREATAIRAVTQEGVQRTLQTVFSSGVASKEVPLTTAVPSMDALKATYTTVLAYEARYAQARSIADRIAAMEQSIDALVGRLEESPHEVSPQFLRALQGYLTTAAVQFDMYGVMLHEAQRLEHCFTLTLANTVSAFLRQ